MKAWGLAIIGAVLAGGYRAAALQGEWGLTSEHSWRAAGSVMAFAIIGLMVGLVIGMIVSPGQPK